MSDDILHFTIEHPTIPGKSEHVRIYEDNPQKLVSALFFIGMEAEVVVRAATDFEVSRLEDIEQEQESHEPDVGFTFPDDELQIRRLINAWGNPLTFQQIYEELVIKCKNTCTDSASSYLHFSEKYDGRFNPEMLKALLDTFNFHALRERRDDLVKHF